MEANPDLFDPEDELPAPEKTLVDLFKDYVETNIEIGKLTAIERITVAMANLFTDGFVLVMLMLVFLFGSVSLGFYLGDVLGSIAGGFGIVTLIYFGLALIMYLTKDKFVEKYLIDFMVKRITNKKNEKRLQ